MQAQPHRGDPAAPRACAGGQQETVVRRAARSRLRRKKGAIVTLYTAPPADSVVICLDEMGPESAKSFPGQRLVRADPGGARRPRATQEIDYGRRGQGYVFGAFVPATGAGADRALSAGAPPPTWVDFLEQVEAWLDPAVDARLRRPGQPLGPPGPGRAALGAGPSALGVRLPTDLRRLSQPDRAVVEDPALLGAEGPPLRHLGRGLPGGGRRPRAYWNAHRHPFVWGRRKRRRPARPAGIACVSRSPHELTGWTTQATIAGEKSMPSP